MQVQRSSIFSFPLYGASLEGNLLCFILFNQALCRFHTYVVSVSFINTTKPSQAKLPTLLFVSCVLKHKRSRKWIQSADTPLVSDYLLDSYQILWNLPALLFSCNYYSCCIKFHVTPLLSHHHWNRCWLMAWSFSDCQSHPCKHIIVTSTISVIYYNNLKYLTHSCLIHHIGVRRTLLYIMYYIAIMVAEKQLTISCTQDGCSRESAIDPWVRVKILCWPCCGAGLSVTLSLRYHCLQLLLLNLSGESALFRTVNIKIIVIIQ